MPDAATDLGGSAKRAFLRIISGICSAPLQETLPFCLLAVLTGAETLVDIAGSARRSSIFFCVGSDPRDGTPSRDHLGEIFATLDADEIPALLRRLGRADVCKSIVRWIRIHRRNSRQNQRRNSATACGWVGVMEGADFRTARRRKQDENQPRTTVPAFVPGKIDLGRRCDV
jgi:hypothetical protein